MTTAFRVTTTNPSHSAQSPTIIGPAESARKLPSNPAIRKAFVTGGPALLDPQTTPKTFTPMAIPAPPQNFYLAQPTASSSETTGSARWVCNGRSDAPSAVQPSPKGSTESSAPLDSAAACMWRPGPGGLPTSNRASARTPSPSIGIPGRVQIGREGERRRRARCSTEKTSLPIPS